MIIRIAYAMLISAVTLTASAQTDFTFPVKATISNGVIEGMYDTKEGIQKYLGIPFAKPPVNDLRWKAPQPPDNWKDVKSTKAFSPRPVQGIVFGDMHSRSQGMSEDCLYLNVWAPATRGQSGLPVLVYFFGGGFVVGDGSEPRYDGGSMAKKGIVTVTVNYRLNIFGFFAHPELSKESSYKASGNYALLDQHAALKWVQQNIHAFGGDPKKVTIAGESAGSIAVSAQLASPLSKGLIAGAIGESGAGINPTLAPVPLAEAEKIGQDFATKAGYKTLAELRALSTREIYEIYSESKRFGFPMVIDNYFMPKSIADSYKSKQHSDVPLLLGWNSSEIPAIAFMQGPMSDENYVKKVKESYPQDYEEVMKLYPHSNAKEMEWSATSLASDRFISYSTWKWFDLHRKNGSKPVYRYLFSRLRAPLADESLTPGLAGGTARRGEPAMTMPDPIGAPHAAEIEYFMGNLPIVKDYKWSDEDYTVSETIQNYLANFIKTGNPNGGNLPQWPAAEAQDTTPPVMIIDVTSKAVDATNDARYLFLDKSYKNN
jgi:para-nitrobenzyl esterase